MKAKRPAHWGPYDFYCGRHQLHGFFGLYANCPVCDNVAPGLLAATRDRMIREGKEDRARRVPEAIPVVRLVAPPPKPAVPKPVFKPVLQLRRVPVSIQRTLTNQPRKERLA